MPRVPACACRAPPPASLCQEWSWTWAAGNAFWVVPSSTAAVADFTGRRGGRAAPEGAEAGRLAHHSELAQRAELERLREEAREQRAARRRAQEEHERVQELASRKEAERTQRARIDVLLQEDPNAFDRILLSKEYLRARHAGNQVGAALTWAA